MYQVSVFLISDADVEELQEESTPRMHAPSPTPRDNEPPPPPPVSPPVEESTSRTARQPRTPGATPRRSNSVIARFNSLRRGRKESTPRNAAALASTAPANLDKPRRQDVRLFKDLWRAVAAGR